MDELNENFSDDEVIDIVNNVKKKKVRNKNKLYPFIVFFIKKTINRLL